MSELGAPPRTRRDGARGSQRGAARANRRRQRTRRTVLVMVVGLAVLVGASLLAWSTLKPLVASFTAEDDYPGPGSGEVRVVIADGATGTDIAQELQQDGVIKSVDAFVKAAAADPRANGIQPGQYVLRKEMSAAGAIEVLADPANRQVSTVTIREGLRLQETLNAVAEGSRLSPEDLEAAAATPAELGLPAQAKGNLEGWLFPATYEVSDATTASDLLSQMVSRTVQELTELGVPQDQWEATIIEASLVEAERGSDADAPKIARVLDNRMRIGMPLQLDTTVNYALKRYKVGVSYEDLKVDSPYNTYTNTGLPPGPINSPGSVAIQGVLNPAEGDWIYFVAVNPDSGETKYATTSAEFAKLKAELDRWLAANPGR